MTRLIRELLSWEGGLLYMWPVGLWETKLWSTTFVSFAVPISLFLFLIYLSRASALCMVKPMTTVVLPHFLWGHKAPRDLCELGKGMVTNFPSFSSCHPSAVVNTCCQKMAVHFTELRWLCHPGLWQLYVALYIHLANTDSTFYKVTKALIKMLLVKKKKPRTKENIVFAASL